MQPSTPTQNRKEVAGGIVALFPTKILLTTDGSEAAKLVALTAVELANKTGSQLHVVS